jgi:hypothetical protein
MTRHPAQAGGPAAVALLLVLAASGAFSARVAAADPLAATPAPADSAYRRVPFQRLGTAEHPIPLAGTETSTVMLPAMSSRERIVLHLDRWQISLSGVPVVVLGAAGGGVVFADPARSFEANVYSGASFELALAPSGSFYLDSGRVVLRDPLDVLGHDGSGSEYWASSAGLAVRF